MHVIRRNKLDENYFSSEILKKCNSHKFVGHELCMSYQMPIIHFFRSFYEQVRKQCVLKERSLIGKFVSQSLKNAILSSYSILQSRKIHGKSFSFSE